MGLFDRFKKREKAPQKGKTKDKKKKEEELKKKQFQAVPSAGSVVKEKKPEEAKKKGETRKKPQKLDTKNAPKILIRPIISEKATALSINNQYVFEVNKGANKIEVRKAIQNLYGVVPFKVNIINLKGKEVRYGRSEGRTKSWKKAVVTLKEGDKIDVYSV